MRTYELLAFIHERQSIYFKKLGGAPKPWTKDPILLQYRFCNVYREQDTVTQWIATHWRTPHQNDPDLWFAMVIARFFNLPTTLQLIGYPVPWKPDQVLRKLNKATGTLFSPAYMVRSDPGSKLEYVVRKVATPLWNDRKQLRPTKMDSLAEFYRRLVPYYGMGSFMVGQVIADTKYTYPLLGASDWTCWATMGPGSARGLNRVCNFPVDQSWRAEDWLVRLLELQSATNRKLSKNLAPLDAQDLQNCLCEFDKYERVRLGEGRPKQRYNGRL